MEETNWEKLVKDHLISTGLFTGVAILTTAATCIYDHGQFSTCHNQNWKQIVNMFTDERPIETALLLELDEMEVKFIVFKKAQSSAYATSEGKLYNLVVCSFPLGVMVCVSKAPTQMSTTVTAAENFISTLK